MVTKEKLFFSLIFSLSVLVTPQENNSNPPTQEENEVPSLNSKDFPHIERPKFVSTRKISDPKEAEAVSKNNEIWQQYQKDLEKWNKIKNLPEKRIREDDRPRSLFYTYTVQNDKSRYLTTFNGLYARLQTRQGSLATINHISSPSDVKVGMTLILPVIQGIFIPLKAATSLEILLQKEFASLITDDTKKFTIDDTQFYFIPDLNFSGTQIAFFHDSGMILPLNKKIVTSEFGYRTSPISGKWKFHAGIDLAAPTGSEVWACKSGVVQSVSYSEIYGNYIVLLHNGNKSSLYAHLSKTLVKKGENVSTGQTIGLVGTTGASTGPHLHFEVRENGQARDPSKVIKNF